MIQSKQMGKRENKVLNMEGRVQFDLLQVGRTDAPTNISYWYLGIWHFLWTDGTIAVFDTFYEQMGPLQYLTLSMNRWDHCSIWHFLWTDGTIAVFDTFNEQMGPLRAVIPAGFESF